MMIKKTSFLLLIASIIFPISLHAQTSKEILEKLSSKAKTWKTISAEFTSTLSDKKNNKNVKQEGTIKVKGQKYILNLPDYMVISDGKSVWSYDKKGNICSVDDMEDMKKGAFNPSDLFTIWEKDFKHEMKNANATLDGIACYEVNLYPNDPRDKSYHTITMFIDKHKLEIGQVVVKTRENTEISYKVKNFKTTADFPDSDFTFEVSKYPGVELTDNRW